MNVLAPVLLSLRVAGIATCFTFLAGIALARSLPAAASPLKRVAEGVVLLPMIFPPTITGYLLLLLLGRRGPIGSLLASMGVDVVFTRSAAVVAAVVVSLPLMYQNAKAAFAGVDPAYARAARTLGLGERRIFLEVTLPLASHGIVAGTVLSFARALGEFGATLMIAGNIPGRTQTIPLALFSAVEGGRDGEAAVYLGVTIAISILVVAVVGWSESRVRGGSR